MSQNTLTVAIITKNEARHLKACLDSLPSCAQVVIVDSGSTDDTEAIARRFGARWEFRAWDDFASQKNYAISLAEPGWVLSLDADEVLSPEMCKKISAIIDSGEPSGTIYNIYRLRRNLVFLGRNMRFGKTIDYPLRLFWKGCATFRGSVHEKLEGDNLRIGVLRHGSLLHFSYDNLRDYFERFNRYTTLVAEKHFEKRRKPGIPDLFRLWFDFVVRYFFRLGFLDGYPGYCYALLSSFYGFVKYAKLREIYDNDVIDGR